MEENNPWLERIMLLLMAHLVFLWISDLSNSKQETIPDIDVKEALKTSMMMNKLDGTLISDSEFVNLKHKLSIWFKSWDWNKDSLVLHDFILSVPREINLKWEKYDTSNDYLKQFDTMLIGYGDGKFIDLYSYGTVLDTIGKNVYASFEVDTKVDLVDKIIGERAVLIFTGTTNFPEDAVWIDDNRVVIVGYILNEKRMLVPYLREYYFKKSIYIEYYSHILFHVKREMYFFTKFKNIKAAS